MMNTGQQQQHQQQQYNQYFGNDISSSLHVNNHQLSSSPWQTTLNSLNLTNQQQQNNQPLLLETQMPVGGAMIGDNTIPFTTTMMTGGIDSSGGGQVEVHIPWFHQDHQTSYVIYKQESLEELLAIGLAREKRKEDQQQLLLLQQQHQQQQQQQQQFNQQRRISIAANPIIQQQQHLLPVHQIATQQVPQPPPQQQFQSFISFMQQPNGSPQQQLPTTTTAMYIPQRNQSAKFLIEDNEYSRIQSLQHR